MDKKPFNLMIQKEKPKDKTQRPSFKGYYEKELQDINVLVEKTF